MTEIQCIYETSLINENKHIKQQDIVGKALDIFLILITGNKTTKELAKELNLPTFSIDFYINRLLEAKLIKIAHTTISAGKIEKAYSLADTNMELVKRITKLEDESNKNMSIIAEHFVAITNALTENINSSQKY